jgi:hypothetical protein
MFGTRDDDDEFRESRRSSIERLRRSNSWHMASIAGLLLALGASGCKDSNGGRGPGDDEDGSVDEDGGQPDGTTPDTGTPDGGPDGSVDAAMDSAVDQDTSTPDSGTDAGPDGMAPPVGISTVSKVEFGAVNCGGDAPQGKSFGLQNTGTTAITYSATLSSTSAFAIEGENDGSKSGTIAPGTSAELTINAAAVPVSATAGQPITASLTVTTNLPAPNNSFVIPLSIVPQGAHLVLSPSGGADWLLVQVGQNATAQTLNLQNTGNLAAAVTVTQPSLSVFTLQNGDTAAADLSVPAAANGTPGAVALSATFNPSVIGPYSSSAALAVTGAICNGGTGGASITSIPFEGAATGSGFTAVASAQLPNRANCGATGAQLPKAVYTVGNFTASALLVSASLNKAGSSPFELNTTALNIAPGTSASVEVTLKASEVPTSATPGDVLSDFVTFTPAASAGLNSITEPLSTTVQGAVLTMSTPAAFTGANNQDVATGSVTISNTGNYPATPTFAIMQTDEVFSVTTALDPSAVPAGTIASPGQSALGLTFRPLVNDVATKTGMLQIATDADDVICGSLPPAVPLSGTPTTAGYNLVSANPIQIGTGGFVDCPAAGVGVFTAAPAQTVTIANNGTVALGWTAAATGTPGFVLNPTSGSIPAGMTADITVTPNALPFPPVLTPNAYGGTLTITTDIPNDSPHDIPIVQTARGAVITVNQLLPIASSPPAPSASPTFGDVNITAIAPASQPIFEIANVGNLSTNASLTWTVSSSSGNAPEFTIDGQSLLKGPPTMYPVALDPTLGVITMSGSFDPVLGVPDSQVFHGDDDLVFSTLTTAITAPGPVCDALPANFDLVGRGTNALFDVAGGIGSLAFRSLASPHQCGANRAAEPKTLVVTNYGNLPLNLTGITLDDSTWFSAYVGTSGTTSATVPAAVMGEPGTAIVVVAPKQVPASSDPTDSTLATTLHILTDLAAPYDDTSIGLTEYISCTQP